MFKLFEKLYEDNPEAVGGAAPEAKPAEQAPAPVEQPQAQEAPPAAEDLKPVSYTDPVAKQVDDLLEAAELSPSKAREAIKGNNGDMTPEIYQALVAKHGEGLAGLLASQMTAAYKEAVDRGNAQQKEVYDFVAEQFKGVTEQSGEESWKELDAWAKDNIDLEKRKELNKIIAQGGMIAKLAVQELVNTFKKSGDFTQEMVGLEGDSTPPTGGGEPLSRAAYGSELDKLLNAGESYDSPKVKALQARRTRGMKAGI